MGEAGKGVVCSRDVGSWLWWKSQCHRPVVVVIAAVVDNDIVVVFVVVVVFMALM